MITSYVRLSRQIDCLTVFGLDFELEKVIEFRTASSFQAAIPCGYGDKKNYLLHPRCSTAFWIRNGHEKFVTMLRDPEVIQMIVLIPWDREDK